MKYIPQSEQTREIKQNTIKNTSLAKKTKTKKFHKAINKSLKTLLHDDLLSLNE